MIILSTRFSFWNARVIHSKLDTDFKGRKGTCIPLTTWSISCVRISHLFQNAKFIGPDPKLLQGDVNFRLGHPGTHVTNSFRDPILWKSQSTTVPKISGLTLLVFSCYWVNYRLGYIYYFFTDFFLVNDNKWARNFFFVCMLLICGKFDNTWNNFSIDFPKIKLICPKVLTISLVLTYKCQIKAAISCNQGFYCLVYLVHKCLSPF